MKCPYEGCHPKEFADFDSSDGKRQTPKAGDVGMCYTCGGWWILNEGTLIQYVPSKEELEEAMKRLEESRQRSIRHYKQKTVIVP